MQNDVMVAVFASGSFVLEDNGASRDPLGVINESLTSLRHNAYVCRRSSPPGLKKRRSKSSSAPRASSACPSASSSKRPSGFGRKPSRARRATTSGPRRWGRGGDPHRPGRRFARPARHFDDRLCGITRLNPACRRKGRVRAYVDSDILIWHLRGESKAAALLRRLSAEPGVDLWTGALQRAEVVF